jgi:hypothetical protein
MTTARSAPLLAVVADAACLAAFVAAGRQSHDIDAGGGWFFGVLWPLVAGWFLMALPLQLYTRRPSAWLRYAGTLVVGVGIALLLRALVTHRSTPVAFIPVAYASVAALTLGWRVLAAGVRWIQHRRDPNASSA